MSTPIDIEAELLRFFTQVANKNPAQLNRLRAEKKFHLDADRWCFTLPSLYAYLQRQEGFPEIEYKHFRKLIFNSPINQTIEAYGATIDIVDNQRKVDQSGYALVWAQQQNSHE